MKSKWIEILTPIDYKYYAYNKKLKSLYFRSCLSSEILILDNINSKYLSEWKNVLKTEDKDLINKWISHIENKNGKTIKRSTEEKTREGSYNVPKKYLFECDVRTIKSAIARNNYLEYKEIKDVFEKNDYIKERTREIKEFD
jgi:hypothetical protein